MQFTPQQLTGGARYSKCRIGNWSEDLELQDLKLKDYLKKKEHGELLVNARQRKLEQALEPVQLSPASGDHTIEFGSTVMLLSHKSEGFLATNPFEELMKDELCRPVSTAFNAQPCVRNTFIVERANENDGFSSNKVHYGQDFRLRSKAFADMTEDNYLHSEHITPLAASKFSRHQEVCLFPKKNGKTLMQFHWVDVKQRFENEGMLVRNDAPLCIRHVHTGVFLASDKILYKNMFGGEFEVHGHNYHSTNKTHNLSSETKGMITGDYQLRRTGLANVFSLALGPPEDEAQAEQ